MARTFAGLPLPDGTRWVDKNQWSPVRQVNQRTTGGSMIYTVQKLHGGRPITLDFPEQTAWLLHQDITRILEWAKIPGQTFLLVWDNQQYVVLFDHTQQPPHEFTPVADYEDPTSDQYSGKIHLITI